MAYQQLNTFQPPVHAPAQVHAQFYAGPPFPGVDMLPWLSRWQPPVPKLKHPEYNVVFYAAPPFAFFNTPVFFPFVEGVSRPADLYKHPFNYKTAQSVVALNAGPQGTAAANAYVAPSVVCDLDLAELKSRLAQMLDDPEVYWTANEMRHAINQAQRLWCFLTLCIERTVSFTLTNAQAFYSINDQITDFLAPLRVSFSGTRLRSDTIHNLDLRDSTWRARPGNPTRYAQSGFDLLAVTPQTVSGSNTLSFTYAAEPAELTSDADVPEIPSEQQPHLVDGAFYFLRLKEGGQELQNAADYLKRFLAAAQKYASFVRSKSRGQLYDRAPFDLATFDKGRFDIKMKRAESQQKKKEEDGK
jgi:hypothetical protein